jgi:hypothetical protein
MAGRCLPTLFIILTILHMCLILYIRIHGAHYMTKIYHAKMMVRVRVHIERKNLTPHVIEVREVLRV